MAKWLFLALLLSASCDLCAQAGVVGFATGGVNPLFKNENNGPAVFWVWRSSGSAGVVTVSYVTNGGTATPDVDYVSVSGTLVWVNGDTADKSFTVPLINDSDEESPETIRVELSNPTGGLGLAPNDDWTMNLLDDDAFSTGGGGDGGGDKDEGCVARDSQSSSWLSLIILFGVTLVARSRRKLFLPVIVAVGCVFVVACSSAPVHGETVRTADSTPVPSGFPSDGQSKDGVVLTPKLTNTLGPSNNSNEKKVFQIHNERNSPGVSNRAWFTLPDVEDRKVTKAELYLARVKRRGDLQPQVTVYDVNLLVERETNFFGATTRLNRVEDPERLVKEDFKYAPLQDAGIDPKTTNPRTDNIPVTSYGDYDVIDLSTIIQTSYARADRELVIQFNYNLDDKAPTVGGFDSDAKRTVIVWARTGQAAPRLKITLTPKKEVSIDDELEELRKMKEKGLLTEDEYLEQKAALLKKNK